MIRVIRTSWNIRVDNIVVTHFRVKHVEKYDGTEKASLIKELDQFRADLLASASHELRTPLTSMKGFASTITQLDIEWDISTQQGFLKTIERESDVLADINEQHGRIIWAGSGDGKGSRFTFSLPIAADTEYFNNIENFMNEGGAIESAPPHTEQDIYETP